MKNILCVLFAAVGLICTTGVAFADTILPAETAAQNVESIQEAIDAAAILPEPGTVTLGEGLFEIDAQLKTAARWALVKDSAGTGYFDSKAIPLARIISRG